MSSTVLLGSTWTISSLHSKGAATSQPGKRASPCLALGLQFSGSRQYWHTDQKSCGRRVVWCARAFKQYCMSDPAPKAAGNCKQYLTLGCPLLGRACTQAPERHEVVQDALPVAVKCFLQDDLHDLALDVLCELLLAIPPACKGVWSHQGLHRVLLEYEGHWATRRSMHCSADRAWTYLFSKRS